MRNNSNLEELKPMIALLQSIFKFEFNEVDDVLKGVDDVLKQLNLNSEVEPVQFLNKI